MQILGKVICKWDANWVGNEHLLFLSQHLKHFWVSPPQLSPRVARVRNYWASRTASLQRKGRPTHCMEASHISLFPHTHLPPHTHTLSPTYTPTFKDQGAFLCSGRWWHKQWRRWHLLESQPGFPNLNVLDIFHLSLASSWVWPTRWMIIATFDLWQIKMSPDVAY